MTPGNEHVRQMIRDGRIVVNQANRTQWAEEMAGIDISDTIERMATMGTGHKNADGLAVSSSATAYDPPRLTTMEDLALAASRAMDIPLVPPGATVSPSATTYGSPIVRDGDTLEVHLSDIPPGAVTRTYGYQDLMRAEYYLAIPDGRYIRAPLELGLSPQDILIMIELSGDDATWFDEQGQVIERPEIR